MISHKLRKESSNDPVGRHLALRTCSSPGAEKTQLLDSNPCCHESDGCYLFPNWNPQPSSSLSGATTPFTNAGSLLSHVVKLISAPWSPPSSVYPMQHPCLPAHFCSGCALLHFTKNCPAARPPIQIHLPSPFRDQPSLFFQLSEFYHIYSCTMIITTQF